MEDPSDGEGKKKKIDKLLPLSVISEIGSKKEGEEDEGEEEEEYGDNLAYYPVEPRKKSQPQEQREHNSIIEFRNQSNVPRFLSDTEVNLSSIASLYKRAFLEEPKKGKYNSSKFVNCLSEGKKLWGGNFLSIPKVNNNIPIINLNNQLNNNINNINSIGSINNNNNQIFSGIRGNLGLNRFNIPSDNNYNINQYYIQNPSLFYNINIQLNSAKNGNNNMNMNQLNVLNMSPYSSQTSEKTSVDSTLSGEPGFRSDSCEFLKYVNSLLFPLDEVLCSQKGARETMRILNRLHNQCRIIMINLVERNLTKIMIDTYGNYFIQQFLENASNKEVHLILMAIRRDIFKISSSFSGTHAMQALVRKITTFEDKAIIVSSIQGLEIQMALDLSASHVLAEVIVRVEEYNREPINECLIKNSLTLTRDSNGTCLLKKFIDYCFSEENKKRLSNIFSKNALLISQNSFGNYCIQHMLKKWGINYCHEIAERITENCLNLSIQKYSSNVVEAVLDISNKELRTKLIFILISDEHSIILLKNKFGRFVLQKAVSYMNIKEREDLSKYISDYLESSSLSSKEKGKIKKNLNKILSSSNIIY